MKTTSLISIILLVSLTAFAQVEIDKTKGTLTGKNDLLNLSIPASMLNSFSINYYTYFFGSDAAGNNAKGTANSVSIEASLEGLNNQLLQEITDEAYTYYLNKWKERGITVTCPSAQEIEATKIFEKDKKKGKAEIVNSGVYQEGNNYAKFMRVLPANAPQVKKEYYGNFVYGNGQFFVDFTKTTSSMSFSLDLNFISFKSGFGSTASISGKTGFKSTSLSTISIWDKTKSLTGNYTTEAIGGSDFVESCDGCKGGSKWKINVNKETYKKVALEMIKKSIDSQFAEYDNDLAKAKK